MAAGLVELLPRLLRQRQPLRLRPRAHVLSRASDLPASQTGPRLRRLHLQGQRFAEPGVQVVHREGLPQRVRLFALRRLSRVRLTGRLPQNIRLRHVRAGRPGQVLLRGPPVRLLVAGLKVYRLRRRGRPRQRLQPRGQAGACSRPGSQILGLCRCI